MKIIRDGKEFELTMGELMNAHDEYELENCIEDIKDVYRQSESEIELTENQIKEIAEQALHNLGKNDSYCESYWISLQCTFDEYVDKYCEEEY